VANFPFDLFLFDLFSCLDGLALSFDFVSCLTGLLISDVSIAMYSSMSM